MAEYNRLTSDLLAKGFDETRYPSYVKIAGGSFGAHPLENGYGGFEYKRDFIWKQAFCTGCGLSVKGQSCITDLFYMGENWCYENNNPVILCPYQTGNCLRNDGRLWTDKDADGTLFFCVCHRAETYDYENSLEKARKDAETEKQKKYEAFKELHGGKICRVHMAYSGKKREWKLCYDPVRCARECYSDFCPIRGRMLSGKKGNVFYDLKISTIRKDDTFFNGEPVVRIEKGKRFLDKPVSLDICTAIAATGSREIYRKEWWNRYSMQHMTDPDLQIEITNLRAEPRESRDLMQDLEDIRNGITVVHASDQKKAAMQNKKERRQQRKQKKIQSLENRIRKQGFDSLSDMERVYAEQLLGEERVNELKAEQRDAPRQLSLFAE